MTCNCNYADECDGEFATFYPLQDGGQCSVRPCRRPPQLTPSPRVSSAKKVNVWDAEGYDALMQEMTLVKQTNIRLRAEIERLKAEAAQTRTSAASPSASPVEPGVDSPVEQLPLALIASANLPKSLEEQFKFVMVGRKWYERFADQHDDCQIGDVLSWEEKTIRLHGYEAGWKDALMYLHEVLDTKPAEDPPLEPSI